MANKLVIILHNSHWDTAEEMGPPFFQAAVAAAMQYETEVILSGRNVELARPGVAESIRANGDSHRSVYDYLREAVEAGASVKVCSPPVGLDRASMITEVQEVVGTAYIISEVMDPDTVTFTY